jgi:hypothetical protein
MTLRSQVPRCSVYFRAGELLDMLVTQQFELLAVIPEIAAGPVAERTEKL